MELRSALALCLAVLCAGQAWAQDDGSSGANDVADLDLESLLGVQSATSTKTEQSAAKVPAVVTVVTAEEILARGYSTLAEVLRTVPGFYDVDNLVTHNIGVRGINGGARSSGNVIKVMIDGHPVDFRPTTGNFLGEELIPIQTVARVEIVRGPASALYGANAFLGVVNVITKKGADVDGFRAVVGAGVVTAKPAGGMGVLAGAGADEVDVLVAGSGRYVDRSGLGLPSSSPDGSPFHLESQGDLSRPRSFLGTASFGRARTGRFSLLASVQNLDAAAEFQDLAPKTHLSHGNRISLVNQNYRLAYDVRPSDRYDLELGVFYFDGRPTGSERFYVGRDDLYYTRNLAASGWGITGEGHLNLTDWLSWMLGADFVEEYHLVQSYDTVTAQDVLAPDGTLIRRAGTRSPGEGYGVRHQFDNVGAYTQGLLTLGKDWGGVIGARLDRHSIYGVNVSARGGLVYAPESRPLSLKLLAASSYKAPSAEQLYSNPMVLQDINGNPLLKPQKGYSLELAATYGFSGTAELSLNVFAETVVDRVEFVQHGLFLQAENIFTEWVVGGEAEARVKVARPLQVRLAAGVARTVSKTTGPMLASAPEVYNPLFPAYQVHLAGDYLLPWWGLRATLEASYVGPRTASQSNALIQGQSYELPGYALVGAAVALPARSLIGDRPTSLTLRLNDVLSTHTSEPGFGGIDVPQPGLTAWLTIVQAL